MPSLKEILSSFCITINIFFLAYGYFHNDIFFLLLGIMNLLLFFIWHIINKQINKFDE